MIISQKKKNIKDIIDEIKRINDLGEYNNLIHQQGYILGERLHNSYMLGIIKRKDVVKMIKFPLSKKLQEFTKFLELKYNILKIKN